MNTGCAHNCYALLLFFFFILISHDLLIRLCSCRFIVGFDPAECINYPLLSLCFTFNCVLYSPFRSLSLSFCLCIAWWDGTLARSLSVVCFSSFPIRCCVWWLVLGHCCCGGLCWVVCVSVYCLRVFFYTYSTQKRDFVVCTCMKLMSICVSVYAFRSLWLSLDVAWSGCCGCVCMRVRVWGYLCMCIFVKFLFVAISCKKTNFI